MSKLMLCALFLFVLAGSGATLFGMQYEMKVKREFDAVRFEQQLQALPARLQTHVITPLFWEKMPKVKDKTGGAVYAEIILIDYRLIPALLPVNYMPELKKFCWKMSFPNFLNFFIIPFDMMTIEGQSHDYSYITYSHKNEFDFVSEVRMICRNRNAFFAIGYPDKSIKAYIHVSYEPTLTKLTAAQIDFILNLFRSQNNSCKNTKNAEKNNQGQPVVLNETQLRIFYSLPQEVQKNLRLNYRLRVPMSTILAVKTPRLAAGLRFYHKYDHQPLVRLAKIMVKSQLAYYLLKRFSHSPRVHHTNIALFIANMLEHKKKFLLGCALVIGAMPIAIDHVAAKNKKATRWRRKFQTYCAMPVL